MADLEPGKAIPDGAVMGTPPRRPLGREASRRFDLAHWARPCWANPCWANPGGIGPSGGGPSGIGPRAGRLARPMTAGSLASRSNGFVAVVGRSLAERAAAGQGLGFLAAGELWPLRPPEQHLPLAGERRHFSVSVSAAERQARSWAEIEHRMRGAPARQLARRPPAVLPRATSLAGQSRVGQGTGPAGAAQRMASQPVFVSNPGEVRAAGGLRSGHDRPGVAAKWR